MEFINEIGEKLSTKLELTNNIDNDKIIIALYDEASIIYFDASSPHLALDNLFKFKERIEHISSRLIDIDEWIYTSKLFLKSNGINYGDNYINGQYYRFTIYSIISLFVCNYGNDYSNIVIEVYFKNKMLSFIDDFLHIHKYDETYTLVKDVLRRV